MGAVSEAIDRLSDASDGYPNSGINDTVIVRRSDLKILISTMEPGSLDPNLNIAVAAALRDTTGLFPDRFGQQWHWSLAAKLIDTLMAYGYKIVKGGRGGQRSGADDGR
jgi:hypothetical protein